VEETRAPEAWVNETVTIRYGGGGAHKDVGVLRAVTDHGMELEIQEHRLFYPWGSVLRVTLGAEEPTSPAGEVDRGL
jgi:hypothetical protein